jgi:hypothetical protein
VVQKVYLHVGAPKTGTTYLQDRLALNRASLARHGVTYPVGLRHTMFLAAVDLTGIKWPGFHEQAAGEWKALVRRIRSARGTVVVSHEVLAVAAPEQIARAMADLAGLEVHVVFTTREPGRLLAADWQEGLKTYNAHSFGRHLTRIVRQDPMTSSRWFWRAQHLPRALARWSAALPPDRVHLVTVPHGDRDALWGRFADAIGIDPSWAPVEGDQANGSLGIIEAQALRRLNSELLSAGVSTTEHRDIVFDRLVPRLLDGQAARGERGRPLPITVPPELDGWVADLAEEWARWARDSRIDVVGDLDDLVAQPRTGPWLDPDEPRPRRVLRLTNELLAAAVQEAAARPSNEARLRARMGRAVRRIGTRFSRAG